jgi:hypothetical protein
MKVNTASLYCSGATASPSIKYHQHAGFSSSYRWVVVPSTVERPTTNYIIEDLIPGQEYFVRVSASNSLGYGSRGFSAPNSIHVPVTQPSTPTQFEWAFNESSSPRVYVLSGTSMLVKIGSPAFSGGLVVTNFNIQWDMSPNFNSGMSGAPLGSVSVPAFKYLCRSCVYGIDFNYYADNSTVTISYQGSPDIVRQLQTGARIVIPTTDDGIPYEFIVGAVAATTAQFSVLNHGLREFVFSTSTSPADLLLMGGEYEVDGLVVGGNYFVRVSASNSGGLCDSSLAFSSSCGAFTATNPSSILLTQPPASPELVSAKVLDMSSVTLSWKEPNSVSQVIEYRVDAFTSSSSASQYYSFFGDSEVQVISTALSNVTSGTFTIAFDKFDRILPGLFSARANSYSFNTTVDVSSYLDVGDQFMIGSNVYTVAALAYKYSWMIVVN